MQKSFFAQYCEERLGKTVLENEHGFLSIVMNDVFYIEDVFIKAESRGNSEADLLYIEAYELAKSKNYKYIYGSVFIKAKGAEKSMKMLLSRNFNFSHAVGDLIYLKKEI